MVGDVKVKAGGIAPTRRLLAWAKSARPARRRRAGPRHAADPRARRKFSAPRLIVLLTVLAMGAMLVSAGIGYGLAHESDERLWREQRAALRNAISEFRNLFGQSSEVDPRFVRMVEQSARLQALRFETEPGNSGREMQPVLDGKGRIAGFFTWEKTHPMTAAMGRMMPFILGAAFALAGFAGISLWQLRRAGRELAASEELAQRAADADKLTGLPNHANTLELLDLALAERAGNEITTFALIELDSMEDLTANLGVLGSDELIVAVAERLRGVLPPGTICGRIGSDEFAIILTADEGLDAEATIAAVLENIARPHWFDTVVRVSAHAGFAQAPRDASTRGELTRRVVLALRAAAKKGPGAMVGFEPALDTISTDQKFIQRDLPRALSANELELHFQPIIAAHGGRIVGVEALLRWTHATRGPIGPAVFIPVAEQMGLMDELGAFVLRRALHEAKRWPDLYVAVNLSPLQVRDRKIVDLVRSALSESGVPPNRLMLEITEGVLIDNPEEMVKRIEDLHALGVRVALDDFGSGYSNLGYLQRFPLDKLKIDRSFVVALGNSANGGVIIQAIVALGRALGLSVLVEGVETEQQRVLLRLAGCDEMQGYLFARPAPAKTIDRLLAQQKANGKAPPASSQALTA
ncbi:MAG: bifunctional diguanylate cyclase/phosphodiesterase [Pseudolabrys sp.]|nr:bifunctional diguanylate cyclase/phosphodiesterase [Pseudolabrys sp.]